MNWRFAIWLAVAVLSALSNVQPAVAKNTSELGNPIIRQYLPKDYNAWVQIWTATQDSRGVLYFGADNNILEFDGNEWRKIPVPNDPVRSMAIAKDGTLYVGLGGDIGFVGSDQNGTLKYISLLDKLPERERLLDEVWKTHATSHGVYFVTYKRIFRYFQGRIEIIPISSSRVYSIRDRLYLVGKTISVLHDRQWHPIPYFDQFKIDKELGRTVILPLDQARVLIVTSKKGLYIHDTRRFLEAIDKGSEYQPAESATASISTELETYFQSHAVYSGVQLDANRFAIGTLGGGIVIFDKRGNLEQIINKNRGLTDDMVFHLHLDRSKNLWACTNGGISQILLSSPLSVFNRRNGIESMVLSIHRHRGTLYVGTYNGIFYLPPYNWQIKGDRHHLVRVKNIRGHVFELIGFDDNLLAAGMKGIHAVEGDTAHLIAPTPLSILAMTRSKKFKNRVFLAKVTVSISSSSSPPPMHLRGFERASSRTQRSIRFQPISTVLSVTDWGTCGPRMAKTVLLRSRGGVTNSMIYRSDTSISQMVCPSSRTTGFFWTAMPSCSAPKRGSTSCCLARKTHRPTPEDDSNRKPHWGVTFLTHRPV